MIHARNRSHENPEVVVCPVARDDAAHYDEFLAFLEREAATFHASISTGKVVEAIRKNQIQGLLLMADGVTVGCTAQFPTAIPRWHGLERKFHFLPAVHSEDMSVSKKGCGTPFMRQRVTGAAGEGEHCGFDLGGRVRAGALVGEQRWHGSAGDEGTAIGGLLSKFATEMAKDRGETILTLEASGLPRADARRDLQLWSLAYPDGAGGLAIRQEMFAATWKSEGVERIAATFTRGFSTFHGHAVVRIHVNSNGHLAREEGLTDAVAGMLAQGRAWISDRGWLESGVDPVDRMYVHALGERLIRNSLVEAGAQDRLIGDYRMYPLVMNFASIPTAMAMGLAEAAPFLSVAAA